MTIILNLIVLTLLAYGMRRLYVLTQQGDTIMAKLNEVLTGVTELSVQQAKSFDDIVALIATFGSLSPEDQAVVDQISVIVEASKQREVDEQTAIANARASRQV